MIQDLTYLTANGLDYDNYAETATAFIASLTAVTSMNMDAAAMAQAQAAAASQQIHVPIPIPIPVPFPLPVTSLSPPVTLPPLVIPPIVESEDAFIRSRTPSPEMMA